MNATEPAWRRSGSCRLVALAIVLLCAAMLLDYLIVAPVSPTPAATPQAATPAAQESPLGDGDFFNLGFWQGFIGNVLATAIGFLLALCSSDWLADRQRRETRDEALRLLRDSANENLQRIDSYLGGAFYETVEPFFYRTVAAPLQQMLSDGELRRAIFSYGNRIERLHELVQIARDLEFGSAQAMSTYEQQRQEIANAIRSERDVLASNADKLRDLINRTLGETS